MKLFFPHEVVRPSQKEMMEQIAEGLQRKRSFVIHAPTGLGKTAAALSATLSFVLSKARERKLVVFFVTPMHTQHKIAVETARLIKEKHNLEFNLVDLIGKRWMCAHSGVTEMASSDFSEYCKDMVEKGKCDFYTTLKAKGKLSPAAEFTLREISGKLMHVEGLKEHCISRTVCPYEITMLMGQSSRLIVADYFHVLSPSVREHLFKRLNISLENCIVVFDEAHNLADRCRDLLSVQLSTYVIDGAVKEANALGSKEIGEDISKLREILESLVQEKTDINTYELKIKKEDFSKKLADVMDYDEFVGNCAFIAEGVREMKKKSFAGQIASFLMSWPGPDEAFVRILKKGFSRKGLPTISITYNCLDPSIILKSLAAETYSLIAMSGTLSPASMYKDLFGFEADAAEFTSPFPKKNKLSLVVPDTTTKYTMRDEAMYRRIAEHCATITNAVPGNSAIFFPSYDLRDKVNRYFESKSEKTAFTESPGMSKGEKMDMIESFKKYAKTGAVLLAASSGNFGEGLDIEDNILKCVVVVGLPLGKPDIQTQELIAYYDLKFGKGWEYGYTMPALIKCFQNAGRAIRSETDKGVIVYLDERFTWNNYFKAFPKGDYFRITKDPVVRVKEFFKN